MYKFIFALVVCGSVLSSESLKCYECKNCLGDLSRANTRVCTGYDPICMTEYTAMKTGSKEDLKGCAEGNKLLLEKECQDTKEKARKNDGVEYYTCRVCTSDECNSDIFKSASLLLVLSLALFIVIFL